MLGLIFPALVLLGIILLLGWLIDQEVDDDYNYD